MAYAFLPWTLLTTLRLQVFCCHAGSAKAREAGAFLKQVKKDCALTMSSFVFRAQPSGAGAAAVGCTRPHALAC